MKKRIITLALALLLAVTVAAPALAADTTIGAGGGTGNTTMTYSVTSTYSVTIPEAVTLATATKTGTLTVSVAANAFIDYGKSIKIKLTTCDFELTNNDDDLTYTIKDGDDPIALNAVVLTHSAGTLTASSKALSLAVTDSAKYAGSYTDQITFTVSVE